MKVQIGEVFYFIQNGANIKQGVVDGGIPITRIETISNNQFNRDRMGYAGITDVQKYSPYILQDGDILMSHINSLAYLGRAVLYNKQNNETIIHGMNLLRLKANREIILPAYACYFFQTNVFKEQINRIAKKSVNQASFSVADLKQTVMSIVPLEEQNKIVNRLDKINSLISLRKKQLQKLDDLVKSRFVELFGDPAQNTMGLPVKTLPEISDNLDSRRIPITSSDRKAGVFPYYGASGIVDYVENYIFDEDILLVSEDGANLLARVTPIAFSVSGKVWVNNHAHVIRFTDKAMQIYVEHLLNMIDISSFVTGTAQPKLNQAKMNSIPIPMPMERSLQAFLEFVKQNEKTKLTVQQGLDKLELLKQSLMQKYFG